MTIKRYMLIALVLFGLTAWGNGMAYAAGLCVHPSGAGKCFTSIQAAVDAANDGDEIIIRAGKYIEQVTILGKDLTLVGRSGATIQAPTDMEDTLSMVAGVEGRPIILVFDANVTIRDLTIDGANSAENNPSLDGIVFINADGVIRDNVVKNIGFGQPTLPIIDGEPSFQGEGMMIVNFGATPRTVTIAENRVVNYNTIGINIFAQASDEDPSLGALTAHVLENTITGAGENDILGQWGIVFGGFDGAEMTGTLKDNRIRDMRTNLFESPGLGILAPQTTNVEISDNAIENVNVGLTLSGFFAQVLENRFKNMDTGILLFVEDPDFGSAIGAVLDENKFENVAMDMITGPGASFATAAAREVQTVSPWQRIRLFPQPLP